MRKLDSNRRCLRGRTVMQTRSVELTRWLAVLALAVGLVGCNRDDYETGTNELKREKPVALKISKRDGDLLKHIGNLRFDEADNGTLETVDSGADAEALRQIWEDVSQRSHLPLKQTRQVEEDGKKAYESGTLVVPKGHPEYNVAVWDTLEREFRYHIDRLEE